MFCAASISLVHRHHTNHRTVCYWIYHYYSVSSIILFFSNITQTDVTSQLWRPSSMRRRNLKPTLSKFHSSKHSFYAGKVRYFQSRFQQWNNSRLVITSTAIEYALSSAETKHIEHLTNGALIALGHYSLQRMQWTRFGKLLLALRCISLRNFDSILKQLFKNIINDVIEDRNVILS